MPTIQISDDAHAALTLLAQSSGLSNAEAIERIIERSQREKYLSEVNASFTRLRQSPADWLSEVEERETWQTADANLLDPYDDDRLGE